MARTSTDNARFALALSARSALISFCTVVAAQLVKALINNLFDGKWAKVDWNFILFISGFAGVVVFI